MSATALRGAEGLPGWRLALAPMGVPLEIGVSDAAAIPALRAACTGWEGAANGAARPIVLRIAVGSDAGEAGAPGITVVGSSLHLRGGRAEGVADPLAGQAACRISAGYLAAPELLRAEVLDPLVLYMLARNDRAPVHASGFVIDELAVLLSGPSGAGKSCLAHAADAAGLAVLSDDTVHVQLQPRLRVWGLPGHAHLLPANAPRGRAFAVRWRHGRAKLAVPLSGRKGATNARRAVLCILERGEAVSLERLTPGQAMRRLEPLEQGFDVVADEVRAAHAGLSRKGAWRLTLSDDPSEAIRFVAGNLARLREASVP